MKRTGTPAPRWHAVRRVAACRTWWLWGALAAALLLVLAPACGGGDSGGEGVPAEPRTFTDGLGRTVTVPEPAERVVALSPSGVETLFAIGVTPVGRPESATEPPEARAVESVGTAYQPNLERIAALTPDLILADAALHADLVPRLEALGVPVYAMDFGSVDRVVASLREAGELTGRTEAGDAAARRVEEAIDAATRNLPDQRPTVVAIIAAGQGQYFAAKPSSYVGSILDRLGARNIVREEEPVGRIAGYTALSQERLAEADPDVIVFVNPVPGAPPLSRTLAGDPAWANLRALREGRVLDADPAVYVQAAGPRVVQAIDELSRLLYPGQR
ncbi:MAG TPA: ABC transporter substrate-binding protein [Dehalococcoidia bacterium]